MKLLFWLFLFSDIHLLVSGLQNYCNQFIIKSNFYRSNLPHFAPVPRQSTSLNSFRNAKTISTVLSVLFVDLLAFNLPTMLTFNHQNQPSIISSAVAQDDDPSISSSYETKVVKLPSGVQYYDAVVGSGDVVADEGRTVQFKWVLRRSNGYFVDSNQFSTLDFCSSFLPYSIHCPFFLQ